MTAPIRVKYPGQSGQAMVEFSLLMLVFVPCLLYGFFLADAGYAQLEVQETVVSTMWDFSQRTAQPEDNSGSLQGSVDAVQAANQAEYIDHTSAFDDTGNLTTVSQTAFNQLSLKTSWGSGTSAVAYSAAPDQGGSRVSCAIAPKVSGVPGDMGWVNVIQGSSVSSLLGAINPLMGFGTDTKINIGGSVVCSARAVAFNYLIPETYLQGFSNVNLTNMQDNQQGTDPDTLANTNGTTGVLLRDQAEIAYGTWAIDDGESKLGSSKDNDIQFGKGLTSSNPFQIRVAQALAGEIAPAVLFGIAQGEGNIFAASTASTVAIANEFTVISALAAPISGGSFGNGDQLINIGPIEDPGIDPYMTFLVARYKNQDGTASSQDQVYGHHPANHCGWPEGTAGWYFDVLTCLAHQDNQYESTPTKTAYQNGTSNFYSAFQARGPYYMGSTDDTQGWNP